MKTEDIPYCIDGCKKEMNRYNDTLKDDLKTKLGKANYKAEYEKTKVDPMRDVDPYTYEMNERTGKTKRVKADKLSLFAYRGAVGTCTAIYKQVPSYETVLPAADAAAVNKCTYVSNMKNLSVNAKLEQDKLDALKAERKALYAPIDEADAKCSEAEQKLKDYISANSENPSVEQANIRKSVPNNNGGSVSSSSSVAPAK